MGRKGVGTAQRRQSGLKSGGRGTGKKFDFFRQFHKEKKSIFQGQFPKNSDFFQVI